jgi:hypothetical protein
LSQRCGEADGLGHARPKGLCSISFSPPQQQVGGEEFTNKVPRDLTVSIGNFFSRLLNVCACEGAVDHTPHEQTGFDALNLVKQRQRGIRHRHN